MVAIDKRLVGGGIIGYDVVYKLPRMEKGKG